MSQIEECIKNTGRKPIGSILVDVDKGDEENLEYRSRVVANEINNNRCQD